MYVIKSNKFIPLYEYTHRIRMNHENRITDKLSRHCLHRKTSVNITNSVAVVDNLNFIKGLVTEYKQDIGKFQNFHG